MEEIKSAIVAINFEAAPPASARHEECDIDIEHGSDMSGDFSPREEKASEQRPPARHISSTSTVSASRPAGSSTAASSRMEQHFARQGQPQSASAPTTAVSQQPQRSMRLPSSPQLVAPAEPSAETHYTHATRGHSHDRGAEHSTTWTTNGQAVPAKWVRQQVQQQVRPPRSGYQPNGPRMLPAAHRGPFGGGDRRVSATRSDSSLGMRQPRAGSASSQRSLPPHAGVRHERARRDRIPEVSHTSTPT